MLEDVLSELKSSMKNSIDSLERELLKRRTGRANVALLDGIKIDYYGTMSPLNQVAAIQVPDPRLITVKPWEKTMLPLIEKAIQQSSLGLNPSSDGEIIRLPIPPLTGERRAQLSKEVKGIGEDTKVAIRNHRRDANDMLKQLEKDKEISEDEMHGGLKKVQDTTDEFVKKVDVIVAKKDKEILED